MHTMTNDDKENDWSLFDYLHHGSHLTKNEVEAALTDLEFAIHHIQEAFRRWSEELNASICGVVLPVQDVSILQVLRMRDRPKSASEIAKALNREDLPNVAYSLRKLERADLIERAPGLPRSQTVYQVSALGRQATEQYAAARRRLLLSALLNPREQAVAFKDATRTIVNLTGLYDNAARRVGMHRPNGSALKKGGGKPKTGKIANPAPRRAAIMASKKPAGEKTRKRPRRASGPGK